MTRDMERMGYKLMLEVVNSNRYSDGKVEQTLDQTVQQLQDADADQFEAMCIRAYADWHVLGEHTDIKLFNGARVFLYVRDTPS